MGPAVPEIAARKTGKAGRAPRDPRISLRSIRATQIAPGLTNIGQVPIFASVCERTVMKQLNLAEAKAKLSHLVDQAAKGKGVIIAKSGVPMAKLVPLDDKKPKRIKFGTLKGLISDEAAAALLEPLPADILDAMLNGPISSDEGK
jgi:prevent-host-death family protein